LDAEQIAELAAICAVLAGLVVLSAVAGALRYLMERLNVEAEALEYRDARDRFERAERRLARGSDPATGVPADEDEARRVVYELGRLALAENEACRGVSGPSPPWSVEGAGCHRSCSCRSPTLRIA
jgi:hypothetical protein